MKEWFSIAADYFVGAGLFALAWGLYMTRRMIREFDEKYGEDRDQ